MKNILITGGAGFIGSSLAVKLSELGYNVTVLDNFSTQIHGTNFKDTYLYKKIVDKVKLVQGDVRCREDWVKAISGQNVIVHLAAETGTGQSMYQIEKYSDVNVNGTSIMLDILTNENTTVEKVVIASSRSIYGEGKNYCSEHGVVYPSGRADESMLNGDFSVKCPHCGKNVEPLATDEKSKIQPASVYAITKQIQEEMVLLVCKSIGVPAVAFRYQNVYGPGQSLKNPYTGILSIFSTNLLQNKLINIFEDGTESRDFVFIDDVVNATILGIEKADGDYQVFNVGSGEAVPVMTIATKLKDLYDSNSELKITGNFRIGDIRHNFADLTLIKEKLGYEPKYDFAKGIKLFAEWVDAERVEVGLSYEESLSEMREKGLLK